MLIDTHAHLNFPKLMVDIGGILARAKEAGVEKIINVGTNLEDSRVAVELAQKYENLYATVGIHPSEGCDDWEEFIELAKKPKVVAIGECGLDFHEIRDKKEKIRKTEVNRQKVIFLKQIKIAQKLNLPLSIHVRDSCDDVINLFTDTMILYSIIVEQLRGVFHCFSGNEKYLTFILSKLPGFYISFAGNVTFKNAENVRELAKLAPLDRLLVETDCPFLAPEPLRGSQNEPANVKITASRLAEIKNVSFEELAIITTENARKLFDI